MRLLNGQLTAGELYAFASKDRWPCTQELRGYTFSALYNNRRGHVRPACEHQPVSGSETAG